MTERRRLWITRTAPQAEATAARLRAMRIEAVVAPVLEIRPIAGGALDLAGAEALAFTSQAAVAAFAAASPERSLPVFAVGAATAAAAQEAGFQHILAPPAHGDVRGLADRIAAADPKPRLVLNPTALEPASDLAALLAARGVAATSLAVYETVRSGLTAAPDAIDGLVVHSAKAAEAVADLVDPGCAAGLTVYAISEAAAASLRRRSFGRILVAEQPNEASLLARIGIDRDGAETQQEP